MLRSSSTAARVFVPVLSILLGAACLPSVPATNPYDPETPIDQQQKATIRGLVFGQVGPIEAAVVTLTGPSQSLPFTTLDDGLFAFEPLLPGAYSLEITHPAYISAARAFLVEPGQVVDLTITLVLLPDSVSDTRGQLTGVVIKQNGSDHSGITVEVEGTGVRTVTNAAGRFDLFLNPGLYDVTLSATSYRTQQIPSIALDAGSVVDLPGSPITLESNPGSISGVVSREGATDHSLVQIEVIEASVEGTSLADGSFTVADVPAGSYTVVASFADFESRLFTGVQVQGGQDTLIPDFELPRSRGHIAGVFTLEGRLEFEGIVVEVVGEGSTAVSNAAGAFTLRDVPVGTYALIARREGFLADTVPTVTVSANSVVDIGSAELLINPGTVTGFFLREGGGSGGNAGIDLTLDGPVTLVGSTAADGAFSIGDVPAGAYTLEAQATGYSTVRLLGVLVTAGQIIDAGSNTLALPRGDLDGRVVIASGPGDILDVVVRIAGTSFSTSPDSSGDYSFTSVPAGTNYVVTAKLAEYATATVQNVVITSGGQSTISDLTLTEQTGDFIISEAPYTRQTTLNLILNNPAADDMRIGEAADLSAVTPITYNPTPTYNLVDTTDGVKTIYVQYIEGGTPSAVFSASFTLDRTPPTVDAILIDGGADFTNSLARLTVATLQVTDAGSGLQDMKLSTDTNFTDDTPRTFATTADFTLASGAQGDKYCYGLFRDFAGNTTAADGLAFSGVQAGADFDVITWDTVTPTLTTVEVGCNGVSPATHCNSPFVSLTLGPSTQEATAVMAFSNSGAFAGASYLPFTEVSTWLLTPGDGSKTIDVKLKDAAGNEGSAGEGFGSIILDTQAPTLSVTLRGTGRTGLSTTLVRSTTVSVLVAATDETTGSGALEMRVAPYANFTSDGTTPVAFAAYAAQVDNVAFTEPSVDGLKRIFVQVRDEAGNVTSGEGSITYDGTVPQLFDVSFVSNVTSATSADLSISATGATWMRLTGHLSGGGSWVAFSTPVTVNLTQNNLDNTITVEVQDDAGNVPAPVSLAAVLYRDTTAPQNPLLTIDGGATYATGQAVLLELSTSDVGGGYGVEEIAVEEGSIDCGTADYQPYVATLAWQLSSGDGDKTVHACFRDAAGNTSTDSATVELDETAPINVSLTINGSRGDATSSTSVTSTASVSYTIGGSDGTGSGLDEMWLSFDPSFATGAWETYATSKTSQTLSPSSGTQTITVYLRVRDNAGNVTESSGSISLDTEPPVVGALVPESSFVTDADVDLSLNVSGATQMCFYGAGVSGGSTDSCAANGWATLASTQRVDLTTGDGDKVIQARFRDLARNTVSASSITVKRDGTEPNIASATVTVTGVAGSGNPNLITRVANVSVAFTGQSDATAGITQMMVSESTGFSGAVWQSVTSPFQWVLSGGDESKEIYIKLRDAAGNATTGYMTGIIELDQTAPTGVTMELDDTADSDDAYTSTISVTANLTATGAAQVCFMGALTNGSSDGCVSNGWSVYAATKPITLTGTQGAKVVALFARDTAGNIAAAASDGIFLDTGDPGTTAIVSVTPYTTSVFLDLSSATDSGSGVVGYEVDYRVVGDIAWSTATFDTDQGTIAGLAAPRVYQFVARAIDGAGRESTNSSQVDRLVGLTTSIVEGFANVGAVGDRVFSGRGMVFFPRLVDNNNLTLLTCDARRGRCTDAGLTESSLDLSGTVFGLGATDNCRPGAAAGEFDVAMTQQGSDLWVFGLCRKMGGDYRTFAFRSPTDPNELSELDVGTDPTTDPNMWRLVDMGVTAGVLNGGETASAAANGQILALSFFENVSTPTLKVRTCRASGECAVSASWGAGDLTFTGLAAADRPTAYTDMDAGQTHLWLAYGSQAPAVRVFGCNAAAAGCAANGDWARVTLPNPGVSEVFSVRVLEVRDTLYVASLQRVGANSGVYLWKCTTSSGCDVPGDFTSPGPISLSATSIGGVKAISGGGERTPRLSLDWSSGYLSFSTTDYLSGNVTFARCKIPSGCALLDDWTPVTVLDTPTVGGQADLTSVGGNPMLFVGRDSARAYILEPFTPSPVGRALLPDLETGGVRAYLTPTVSSDGYVASYNTTAFTNAFATQVLALNPNTETFEVTSSTTPSVWGNLRAFRGSDLSFDDPFFRGTGASPRTISGAAPKFPRYEKSGQCHVNLYVTGNTVRGEACPLGGSCTLGTDWKTRDIFTVTGTGATGLASSIVGETVWLAVTGEVTAANSNARLLSVALDSACNIAAPTVSEDVFNGPQNPLASPALLVTPGEAYIVLRDSLNGVIGRRCVLSTGCDVEGEWPQFAAPATFPGYQGGDMVMSAGRVFWVGRRDTGGISTTFVSICNPVPATFCNASGLWSNITLMNRGPTFGAGSLNTADGYLLWTQEGELAWCSLATGCDDVKEWQTGGLTPDYLSPFEARAGVLGRETSTDDLMYVGYGLGGVYISRCPARCWESDSWFGGFVGRSAQYGAVLWDSATYNHWGRMAGLDTNTGEVTLVYRFIESGSGPSNPSALRFNTGMKFEISLAP